MATLRSEPGRKSQEKLSSAIKKLERSLTCQFCLGLMNDARMLPCMHVFCKDCVINMRYGEDQYKCPQCRMEIRIPEIEDLPEFVITNAKLRELSLLRQISNEDTSCSLCHTNDAAYICSDCGDGHQFLCHDCSAAHENNPTLREHSLSTVGDYHKDSIRSSRYRSLSQTITQLCPAHGLQIRHFCSTCFAGACADCSLESHDGHVIQQTPDPIEDAKSLISEDRNTLLEILTVLNCSSKPIEKRRMAIQHQHDHISDDINVRVSKVSKDLERHRKTLVQQMNDITRTKVDSLNRQLQLISAMTDKIEHLIQLMFEAIESPTECNLFSIGSCLLKNSADVKSEFEAVIDSSGGMALAKEANYRHQASLVPCEMANLSVNLRPEKVRSVLREGAVILTKTAVARRCSAHGPGLTTPTSLQLTYFRVNVCDASGLPCTSAQDVQVSVALGTMGHALLELPKVTHNTPGVYMVSYCPHTPGSHFISVTVNEEPISGSPFHVRVRPCSSLALKSQVFESLQQLRQPVRLTWGHTGSLLVGDGAQLCMMVLVDSCGACQRSFPLRRELKPLKSIGGIAIDKDGFMYTTSTLDNILCKYSPAGTLLKELDRDFNAPMGIRISPADEIFVCDSQNSRVQIFDRELHYKREISLNTSVCDTSRITRPSRPYDIDFNVQGTIFISDEDNDSVLVFNTREKLQMVLWQFEEGELNGPTGIAIDEDNFLYICDTGNHRVVVFQSVGDPVIELCTEESCSEPVDVTVDNRGCVYVCDRGSQTIKVFQDTIVKMQQC